MMGSLGRKAAWPEQTYLLAILRIKGRVATTEAGKPIRQAIWRFGPRWRLGGVVGGGVERSTSLNHIKVPVLWSNISSFISSN